MDFEKICTIFTMQEPYYGILLSAMDRYPTTEVPTIGVRRSGNVFRLGYNPDFIADKDLQTVMTLLKHETLHLAFCHLTFFENKPEDDYEHQIRNLAGDMEVNSYLDFSGTTGLNPCLPELMGWDKRLGILEYYNRLHKMFDKPEPQKAHASDPQKPCNGGRGGQNGEEDDGESGGDKQSNNNNKNKDNQGEGEPEDGQPGQKGDDAGFNQSGSSQSNNPSKPRKAPKKMQKMLDDAIDDHSMWPDDMTEEQMEDLKQAIDDLCVFAAEEVEKGCGDIPGEMQGRIKLIRDKKKPKPVADWKKYFRRYIGNEFSDQIKKSRKRESMRFPDAAGNRHKRKSHILVAIDTSGSVSMPEYREFFGQLKTMKDVTFHVVECDARIQHEYDFNGTIHETLHGGGGTSFWPPIQMYLENRRKYEGLVYFTDGYCDIPNVTPKETLWVVSSNGDHDRKKYQRNGASVVFIPPKKNNG